ncbi:MULTISPECIES: hypothetical protein [unclassified Sphingosinithalassobacter]|uniref:hypothetical protein n=1 Tax=unclassified Sphingosinithalassobacter TaxID=2676235 RepID=UPI00165E10E4|nr:hypothetical protein [Sphingosinithalassobacter sp. CS137]
MAPVQIGIGEIAELGTQVGMYGSVRAGEVMMDDVFEMIVAIANLIYELYP